MTPQPHSPPRTSTPDDFARFVAAHPHTHYELIAGEIVEKAMTTQLHGRIASLLVYLLMTFVLPRRLGHVETETSYQAADDNTTIVQPDAAFTADWDTPPVRTGITPRLPDLAIEIKSPTDRLTMMRRKAEYYTEHSTRLMWLIHPEHRMVEVYRPGHDVLLVTGTGVLEDYDVLPGFVLPLADLFTEAA